PFKFSDGTNHGENQLSHRWMNRCFHSRKLNRFRVSEIPRGLGEGVLRYRPTAEPVCLRSALDMGLCSNANPDGATRTAALRRKIRTDGPSCQLLPRGEEQ